LYYIPENIDEAGAEQLHYVQESQLGIKSLESKKAGDKVGVVGLGGLGHMELSSRTL
jgi:D-arabinose 1-dehydrogenase-like Zn-dependent alcohol dehydrogenase